MRVLVTGANGFVGARLLRTLHDRPGVDAIAGVRRDAYMKDGIRFETRPLGDLAQPSFSASQFTDIDVIIHTAGHAHVLGRVDVEAAQAFLLVNVTALGELAAAAASAGVKRFVFLSSIKVNGEETHAGACYTAADQPAPQDAYGISKYEAEKTLQEACRNTGMEWVIVRPPLVYGPGVKANFLQLMASLRQGLPMPLGALHNQRSLVALDNLIDLLVTCLDHPHAANQVLLVSDGDDISVRDLAQRLNLLLGARSWLLPVPISLLRVGLVLFGQAATAQRLCGELRIDINKTRSLLGWIPPLGVDEALALTTAHYLEKQL